MLTQLTAGTNTYIYRCDGLGKRVARIENGTQKRYVGGLVETDASGNIIAYYVRGLGLISKVTPTNQAYHYHYDGIGSTVAITDSSGNIVNKYTYDAFGKVLDQVEAIPNPFKYVGQFGVMDEGNGLFFMRARYYDPEAGRFISKDPIGFAGGDLNLYAYVANNPVNWIDPFGLRWYKSLIFWIDVVALVADASVIITGPVGPIVGAIASISSTSLTINEYRKGNATKADVVVSAMTTLLGFIPLLTIPADVAILFWDYHRAEESALPCEKK